MSKKVANSLVLGRETVSAIVDKGNSLGLPPGNTVIRRDFLETGVSPPRMDITAFGADHPEKPAKRWGVPVKQLAKDKDIWTVGDDSAR